MAVSSLKVCWSKLSARIRDYIDVVDSYYRPNVEDEEGDTDGQHNHLSGGDIRTPRGHITYGDGHDVHKTYHKRTQSRLSQLGWTKRKTSHGQIYFVDANGNKDWHDPSVPKELINANLDLDRLIGPLTSNWEMRQTPSGKTYFTNHLKLTTQLTDPRLVAYKDVLMTYLRRHNLPAYESTRSRRQHQTTSALHRGSHQNLSMSSGGGGGGNSNTLTGPPPLWFKQPALNVLSEESIQDDQSSRPSCNRDQFREMSSRVSTGRRCRVPATPSNSPARIVTRFNHARDSPNSPNAFFFPATATPPVESTLKANNESNNRKELFDKISILRQELLKQQDLTHPCKISINRKRIFEDSFRAVIQLSPRDLKKRLLIKFRGEEGLDYGGVAREWFYLLSKEILNPAHGLFQYTSDDIYNLQINPDSGIVYREHLSYLNFCGRIIGMAVFHGHFIEGRFTLPFYKMLLKKPITLSDIAFVDPELHRSLCWILENDITDIIDTTFLVQHNAFGRLQEYELKENGRNISVTEENKLEYVTLYVNYRCRRGIEHQFEALQRGFYEIIAPVLVDTFDEHELELLIGGLSEIDIDDWRVNTKLKNCTVETPLVVWFWDIVKSYDEDRRARLLQFVTGSPRVPIQGFKALQGVNSELRLFTIHMIRNGNTDNLPKSHTCFNRIDLPPYETYDKLRDKLTQAIDETMGFAMQ